MISRHTRWMRRTALLACLLGAAVIIGGYLAIGAAGDEKTRNLTGSKKAEEHSEAKLPPLPKKLRARVVEPEAGSAGQAQAEVEQDPGLDDPGPKPTGPASSGGRRANGVLGEVDGSSTTKATALSNGVALPPLEAPEAVRQIIEAGNSIARTPYKWGGGHGKWQDTGYDCSGSVSFALAAAGLLNGPMASGPLMSWGEPGPGKWVTIYANNGHVYMYVAGVRFDTSNSRVTSVSSAATVTSGSVSVASGGPSGHSGPFVSADAGLASPGGVPPVTHVSSTFSSRAVSPSAWRRRRPPDIADHGGMWPAMSSSRIDSPQGTVSSTVVSGIGAGPPAT